LEGNFPLVLACNGKPKIHVDQDSDAWLRRLVVLSFKKPDHDQHIGKMGELILKTEASGILNWLLEGRAKLAKDKLQLTQTTEQKARAVNLLLGSDSPAAFVRCCIQKQKGGVIWMAELYEHYQKWCRKHSVSPSRSVDFMRMAKGTIETEFGLSPRHDLIGEQGKARRGWSGLAVVEGGETIENQSSLSE
jgi:phage/plasmid-associated DNA primase